MQLKREFVNCNIVNPPSLLWGVQPPSSHSTEATNQLHQQGHAGVTSGVDQ